MRLTWPKGDFELLVLSTPPPWHWNCRYMLFQKEERDRDKERVRTDTSGKTDVFWENFRAQVASQRTM